MLNVFCSFFFRKACLKTKNANRGFNFTNNFHYQKVKLALKGVVYLFQQ